MTKGDQLNIISQLQGSRRTRFNADRYVIFIVNRKTEIALLHFSITSKLRDSIGTCLNACFAAFTLFRVPLILISSTLTGST